MKTKTLLLLIITGIFIFIGAGLYKNRAKLKIFFPAEFPELGFKDNFQGRDFKFPEKIWLHRVNTLERALTMQDKYLGFEIDVVYDSNKRCFDILHPPDTSIGLFLENHLDNLKHPAKRFYWLDFKNLNSGNEKESLENLVNISDKYKIDRKRIIVESNNPEQLSSFTQKGFYTSYYIPEFNPYNLNKSRLKEYLVEISSRLENSEVNAISGYSYQLPFMQKYFPERDCLTWMMEEKLDFIDQLYLKKLQFDDQVKVLLVREHSKGYR